MSLLSVLHHAVRPDQLDAYQDRIRQLSERARERKESFHWNGFQTAMGELGNFYFAAQAESWSALEKRGTAAELVQRLMGEKDGRRWRAETTACLLQATQTVSVDRPELSYAPDAPARAPFALVTAVRTTPGGQEAFEEFLHKIAEAIPKVDDRWRLATRQIVIGNLREYRTVRPLQDLAQLDTLPQPERLLTQAFGAAEAGLVYRNGMAAIEHVERRIIALRQDLSNPPS
jgi:hypothetical protein